MKTTFNIARDHIKETDSIIFHNTLTVKCEKPLDVIAMCFAMMKADANLRLWSPEMVDFDVSKGYQSFIDYIKSNELQDKEAHLRADSVIIRFMREWGLVEISYSSDEPDEDAFNRGLKLLHSCEEDYQIYYEEKVPVFKKGIFPSDKSTELISAPFARNEVACLNKAQQQSLVRNLCTRSEFAEAKVNSLWWDGGKFRRAEMTAKEATAMYMWEKDITRLFFDIDANDCICHTMCVSPDIMTRNTKVFVSGSNIEAVFRV